LVQFSFGFFFQKWDVVLDQGKADLVPVLFIYFQVRLVSVTRSTNVKNLRFQISSDSSCKVQNIKIFNVTNPNFYSKGKKINYKGLTMSKAIESSLLLIAKTTLIGF
jgi:hypothetical protein